jgi:hypothetical protein
MHADVQVAVSGNPDVYRTDIPLSTLLYHDFWGNKLFTDGTGGWTHHSWRPLVVLSFRLDWLIGRGSTEPFHVANWCYHIAAVWTAFATALAVFGATARRRAPIPLRLEDAKVKEEVEATEEVESEGETEAAEETPAAEEIKPVLETTDSASLHIEDLSSQIEAPGSEEAKSEVAAVDAGNPLAMPSDSSSSPSKAVKRVTFVVNNPQNAPQHRNSHNKHNRGQRDGKSQRSGAKRQVPRNTTLPPVATAVVAQESTANYSSHQLPTDHS